MTANSKSDGNELLTVTKLTRDQKVSRKSQRKGSIITVTLKPKTLLS